MTTVSNGADSTGTVEVAAAYERPTPVECTIRPAAFVWLTVAIVAILVVSVVAIYAGANFDGGQPGITGPAGR